MTALLRFFKILRVIVSYRLDQLLPKQKLPWFLRVLLAPLCLLPNSKLTRGQRLRFALQDLGPIFVKFGQLLSTRPDLVAADIVTELSHLQDNVAPFEGAKFTAIVEQSLGRSVTELFASFETEPLASASVAQVHAAVLKDGRDVVVKAIRPGIESTIQQDISLLFKLAGLVQRFSADGKRLRLVEVVEDYQYTILNELNLQMEAANACQLRRNFSDSPMLYIPEVHWDYCSPDVMVMERIYGIPVTNLDELAAQDTNMKVLAERGVELFFTQVFKHNFFHADMHPGNIFVSRNTPSRPQYIAVDMAIVGSLDREDQYYLARNLLAIFRRDYRQVAELHVQCGWVPADTRISEFETAIRSVCEPIFEKPLAEISFGQVLINLFHTARRFDMEIQPQLVLLQKTLLNIEGLGRQLYPELDLWNTAHPYLEDWLSQRFAPNSLWDEFKRHAPEWMEKFPEIPQLIFENLDAQRHNPESGLQLARLNQQLEQQNQKRRRYGWPILGLGCLAGVILMAPSSDITQLPVSLWVMGVTGLGLLLKR